MFIFRIFVFELFADLRVGCFGGVSFERIFFIAEQKIIFKIGRDIISVKWKQYSHFLENSEFYLFYYTQETFLILPKRAFSLEENERFKKMADFKMGMSTVEIV